MSLWTCRAVSGACVAGGAASERRKRALVLISPPAEYTELFWALLLAQPHGVSLLAAAAREEEFPARGMQTFPRKAVLSLPVLTDAKPSPFSPTSNSNSTLQSCLPSYKTVAREAQKNYAANLSSAREGKGFPQPCRSGSARFRLGSQLSWLDLIKLE